LFIIGNSIRQTLRTPVKTVAFLLLILLSALFLAIGINLRFISEQNMQAYEDSFQTVGTVEQLPDSLPEYSSWDNERIGFATSEGPVFDEILSTSALDFEGVNYIYPPVHRPYYGAYHEDYTLYNEEENIVIVPTAIIEAEPLKDCDPAYLTKLKIKKVLCGTLENKYYPPISGDEIWFTDFSREFGYEQNYPMYAGKTYILPVTVFPISAFPELDTESGTVCVSTFQADNIRSKQYDANGEPVADEYDEEDVRKWEEVTKGFYDTPRGKRWLELIKGFYRPEKTIPVMPVSATHLLMDFYNGDSNVIDGRDINDEEYESGKKVCLITKKFADLNDLKVGDPLPLPLYYADYGNDVGDAFSSDSLGGSMNYLNGQGEMYPVFEDSEYTIVGIYSPGPAAGEHMVIVPAASIKHSDENNITSWDTMTVHNTSFEIPNGSITEFMEALNSAGFDKLDVHIYDKGYTQLKAGVDRMRVISTVLLMVGSSAMILILIFFTFLFIIKSKKRIAIERSLGLSKKTCALSLFCSMMPLTILGIAAGSVAGYQLSGFTTGLVAEFGSKDAFDLSFSNWVNDAGKLAQVQIDSQAAGIGVIAMTAFAALVISVLIVCIGVWRNLRYEPLSLLSKREDE